jgi:hypothetical protein
LRGDATELLVSGTPSYLPDIKGKLTRDFSSMFFTSIPPLFLSHESILNRLIRKWLRIRRDIRNLTTLGCGSRKQLWSSDVKTRDEKSRIRALLLDQNIRVRSIQYWDKVLIWKPLKRLPNKNSKNYKQSKLR